MSSSDESRRLLNLASAGGRFRRLTMAAVAVLAGLGGWTLARINAPPAVHLAVPASVDRVALALPEEAPGDALGQASSRSELPGFPATVSGHTLQFEAVARTLRTGGDSARLAALNSALEHDVALPSELLIEVYERPGGEELRQLAFETYIDSIAADVATGRAAMQSATASDSPAVRGEAYRRLDQLDAYEAVLAESAARLSPAIATTIGGTVP